MTDSIAEWFVNFMIYTLLGLIVLGPLVVHVYHCVATNWAAMLIIGLVFPPVGWVHGVGLIFGFW